MSQELEVTRGRGWMRQAGNALVVLSMLSVPASCLGLCASFSRDGAVAAAGISGGIVALGMALLALLRLAMWGAHRIGASWTRRQLRAKLAEQLEREGLGGLDPADPARLERERVFWRDEQLNALVALRRRFAVDPQPLDLVGAVRVRLLANRKTLTRMGVLSVAAVTISVVYNLNVNPAVELTQAALPGLGVVLSFASVALLFFAGETLSARNASRAERRVFERESRRIVTMAELAGGLTLAEHEIDAALRGALSAEVAQGGELEQVIAP
jgi:hypothetical protein